jgi:spermidine synthase
MMSLSLTGPDESGVSRRYLLLLPLLAGSGCAALIYEVVWYQLLQLAIGSTAVSLGFLLATFMGGLCLGSLGMAKLGNLRQHPLLVYAVIELGIAACGLLVLFGLPYVDRVYVAGVERGLPGMLLRGFIAAVCMLPPTILMGASLPAVSRWIESTRKGASWWGLLYGANTFGAVAGCLLAGFYLLRLHNTSIATYVAVAINAGVALLSLTMASRTPARAEFAAATQPVGKGPASAQGMDGSSWGVHMTIGISGACAMGAEVVWTRLMGMTLGTTVYVFSIILAVFLIGLALGSLAGSWISRAVNPRAALGWCQLLQAAGVAWAAGMIAQSLPYWPIDPMLSTSPWYTFQLDVVRCLWAVLPAAALWGASFPLALSAATTPGKDPGKVVGTVYAANTLGAIVGALSISLWLVPWIGTQRCQQALLIASASGGLFVLIPHVWRRRSKAQAAALIAAMGAAQALAWTVEPFPPEVTAYGRRIARSLGRSEVLHSEEGRNSSVVITRWSNHTVEICVNGHVEATTADFDMRLQRMVAHLPALLHPGPKSVLGIGFGAGVSAGTFTRHPSVRKITICEIEPIIPRISTRFFTRQNYNVANDPRTRIVFDDARHYVMTTTEKFDIIASDPLDVFAKGTAALYSVEYFEAVKRRLNPGGIFTLYVPLYESDLRTVKSELATFFEAFPNATIWANTVNGAGYDMVFMGHLEPVKINLNELMARFESPEYAPVAASLQEVGVYSLIELLANYAGRQADLGSWVRGSELNRDRDLRLQYLAGWGIDSRLEHTIYREILKHRRMPEGLFVGTPELVLQMQQAITMGPRD